MTKELIKMNTDNKGVLTMSARLLHEKLEVKTEFNHWIERMIDYGFEEKNGLLVFFGEKYRRTVPLTMSTATKRSTLYVLTQVLMSPIT